MHGFIFIEFEKFALTQMTYPTWYEVLAENNLRDRQYSPIELYPDSEILGLLQSVSQRTHLSPEKLLEMFGINIVPDLMKVYRAYIDPDWTTMDLLENAEKTIHVSVRKSTAGAAPPILDISRPLPNEIIINYVSGRHMVELGVGIIKGLAKYYKEADNIAIELIKDIELGKSIIKVRQLF